MLRAPTWNECRVVWDCFVSSLCLSTCVAVCCLMMNEQQGCAECIWAALVLSRVTSKKDFRFYYCLLTFAMFLLCTFTCIKRFPNELYYTVLTAIFFILLLDIFYSELKISFKDQNADHTVHTCCPVPVLASPRQKYLFIRMHASLQPTTLLGNPW